MTVNNGNGTASTDDFIHNGTLGFIHKATGNVGIGVSSPTNEISLSGQANRKIWLERMTTAATAGKDLTIEAGGAVSGGTDLAGGNLVLDSGIATGNGASNIQIATVKSSQGAGTSDRNPSVQWTFKNEFFETAGTAPTISSCGTTPNGSVSGNSVNGAVTVGGGVVNSCTVTFPIAATNALDCQCTNETSILLNCVSTSTSVLTINGTAVGGNIIHYFCARR